MSFFSFFFNDTATTEIYTLSLHDALPICQLTVTDQFYDSNSDAGSNFQILGSTGSATDWVSTSTLFTAGVDTLPSGTNGYTDRKSTRLNSSHIPLSRMPSSA